MFSLFTKAEKQKDLFYQLKEHLQYDKHKTSGIYAIFKNGVCVYVGQSKNIPSRLATHLTGKYKTSDQVLIYVDEDELDDLIPSEKFLIQYYKPTDNVLADYTEDLDIDNLIGCFHDFVRGANIVIEDSWSYMIINNAFDLFVCDSEIHLNLLENQFLFKYLKHCINSVENHKKEVIGEI
jgi:hypothetical protein